MKVSRQTDADASDPGASDPDLLRTFLRQHELFFSKIRGAHLVFDAPPDFCGVVVILPGATPLEIWVRSLSDRGWCVVRGSLSKIVWRLTDLYALL